MQIILKDVVELLSHLGDALFNISVGLERTLRRGFVTFDYIAARRARRQLVRLHKFGTELGASQMVFPEVVLWYVEDPSTDLWADLQEDVRRILDALPDLEKEVARSGSALVLEPMYKDYIVGIAKRRSALSKLLGLAPPTAPEDLEQLREIGRRYSDLMLNLERIQVQLADYIRRNFPLEREWLDDLKPYPERPAAPPTGSR
jgi:hypothetical protein